MNINFERVVIGTALVVATPILLPIVKTTVGMAGDVGARTMTAVWSGVRTTARVVKEEVEDIVAEAQFERLKKHVDQEIYHQKESIYGSAKS
jgi:hypothetical protein